MINVIIIDDEIHCRNSLRTLLESASTKVNVMADCASAEEGKKYIESLKPNLVFLDVEMPGKSGFDLLDELEEINFEIVFTTAFEQYAIQAIKSSALDYLLKPIMEKDLLTTLSRFEVKKKSAQTLKQVEVLLENYGSENSVKRVAVPTLKGIEFLRTDEIIRLEADSNYSIFILSNQSKLVVAKTLKEMEELLPENSFYRVHHSHIVGLKYIKRYQKNDGGYIIMEDGSQVPISGKRKEEFFELVKGERR